MEAKLRTVASIHKAPNIGRFCGEVHSANLIAFSIYLSKVQNVAGAFASINHIRVGIIRTFWPLTER